MTLPDGLALPSILRWVNLTIIDRLHPRDYLALLFLPSIRLSSDLGHIGSWSLSPWVDTATSS